MAPAVENLLTTRGTSCVGGWEVEWVSENESWLTMDSRHVTDQYYIWNPDFLTCHIHKYISLILRLLFHHQTHQLESQKHQWAGAERWDWKRKKTPNLTCVHRAVLSLFLTPANAQHPVLATWTCYEMGAWGNRHPVFFLFFKRAASVISPCCPVKYPHPHFITHFPCWQMKSRQCCQLILHSFFFFKKPQYSCNQKDWSNEGKSMWLYK